MAQKNICLITTGGTIAGNVAIDSDKTKQTKSADELNKLLRSTKREIKDKWQIDINITPIDLVNKDSSDINSDDWTNISDTIHGNYDKYDAFVVTHGTNTLGYTSAALSFALENLNKPVVLTGSQVPFGTPGADALTNLENALRVSIYPNAQIKGVVAVFGSRIITGTRVKKSTEFDYDAFHSFQSNGMGVIGRVIIMDEDQLAKHNSYLMKTSSLAIRASQLVKKNIFNTNMAVISEFPSMPRNIFRTLVDQCGVKGIILRAFGAGDPCTSLHDEFKFLRDQQIPVVVTTQAANGNSNFKVNESGQYLAKHGLAIPAYDMSMEAMVAKFSWLMGQSTTYEAMSMKMLADMHGEIKVHND